MCPHLVTSDGKWLEPCVFREESQTREYQHHWQNLYLEEIHFEETVWFSLNFFSSEETDKLLNEFITRNNG